MVCVLKLIDSYLVSEFYQGSRDGLMWDIILGVGVSQFD